MCSSDLQQVVDSWPVSLYRTAHYMVQVTDVINSRYQSSQLMLIQDGTNCYITEYNDIYTDISLGAFSADVITGSVSLLFTPISPTLMNVRLMRTTIDI